MYCVCVCASITIEYSTFQIDLVSEEEKETVKSRIRGINTNVEIIECTHGKVDPDLLLDIKGFDLPQVPRALLVHVCVRVCMDYYHLKLGHACMYAQCVSICVRYTHVLRYTHVAT